MPLSSIGPYIQLHHSIKCDVFFKATKVSPSVTATKTSPSQQTPDLSPNSAAKEPDFGQGKGKPNLRVVIPAKSEVRLHVYIQ